MAPQNGVPLTREELDRINVQVRPPGVALKVVGVLWAIGGLALSAVCASMLIGFRGDGVGDGFRLLYLSAAAAVIGPIALVAGGVTAFGGCRLSGLRSYRWAVAGAVTAVIFGLFGCFLCFLGVIGLPLFAIPGLAMGTGLAVGGWATNVLNDPTVKSAFR